MRNMGTPFFWEKAVFGIAPCMNAVETTEGWNVPFPQCFAGPSEQGPRGGLGSTHLPWLAILSNKGHFSIGSWHRILPECCVSTGWSLKCPLHVWTDNGPANCSTMTPCGLLFKAVKKRKGGAGEVLNGTMGHLPTRGIRLMGRKATCL